ncbi:hypothetical protein EYF80_039623 [Liparis tanakae]|uniref:Uncharacterized protein n=1 Tax=Liparis tanakae TaxID=230148 RepID=A0A4Z2G9M6_9TELE|nr:hypothetical protein EYF80_039623 [Liparis tanakae]
MPSLHRMLQLLSVQEVVKECMEYGQRKLKVRTFNMKYLYNKFMGTQFKYMFLMASLTDPFSKDGDDLKENITDAECTTHSVKPPTPKMGLTTPLVLSGISSISLNL